MLTIGEKSINILFLATRKFRFNSKNVKELKVFYGQSAILIF